jgi:hypothetical protein
MEPQLPLAGRSSRSGSLARDTPQVALYGSTLECNHLLIATSVDDTPRINLRDEHIASRKDWGAYVDLKTEVHRREVAQVTQSLAQLRARLEQATLGKEKK